MHSLGKDFCTILTGKNSNLALHAGGRTVAVGLHRNASVSASGSGSPDVAEPGGSDRRTGDVSYGWTS